MVLSDLAVNYSGGLTEKANIPNPFEVLDIVELHKSSPIHLYLSPNSPFGKRTKTCEHYQLDSVKPRIKRNVISLLTIESTYQKTHAAEHLTVKLLRYESELSFI